VCYQIALVPLTNKAKVTTQVAFLSIVISGINFMCSRLISYVRVAVMAVWLLLLVNMLVSYILQLNVGLLCEVKLHVIAIFNVLPYWCV
jgi:hypothetical protein